MTVCKYVVNWLAKIAHRKVAAGKSSFSQSDGSIFLSENITLFTNFARAEDVITMSHSKRLYIMYVNYMLILIFRSSFDVYK